MPDPTARPDPDWLRQHADQIAAGQPDPDLADLTREAQEVAALADQAVRVTAAETAGDLVAAGQTGSGKTDGTAALIAAVRQNAARDTATDGRTRCAGCGHLLQTTGDRSWVRAGNPPTFVCDFPLSNDQPLHVPNRPDLRDPAARSQAIAEITARARDLGDDPDGDLAEQWGIALSVATAGDGQIRCIHCGVPITQTPAGWAAIDAPAADLHCPAPDGQYAHQPNVAPEVAGVAHALTAARQQVTDLNNHLDVDHRYTARVGARARDLLDAIGGTPADAVTGTLDIDAVQRAADRLEAALDGHPDPIDLGDGSSVTDRPSLAVAGREVLAVLDQHIAAETEPNDQRNTEPVPLVDFTAVAEYLRSAIGAPTATHNQRQPGTGPTCLRASGPLTDADRDAVHYFAGLLRALNGDIDLPGIAARRAALTAHLPAGDWAHDPEGNAIRLNPAADREQIDLASVSLTGVRDLRPTRYALGEFLAHAPGDITALLTEVQRLRGIFYRQNAITPPDGQ